jgi:hypothetical protein
MSNKTFIFKQTKVCWELHLHIPTVLITYTWSGNMFCHQNQAIPWGTRPSLCFFPHFTDEEDHALRGKMVFQRSRRQMLRQTLTPPYRAWGQDTFLPTISSDTAPGQVWAGVPNHKCMQTLCPGCYSPVHTQLQIHTILSRSGWLEKTNMKSTCQPKHASMQGHMSNTARKWDLLGSTGEAWMKGCWALHSRLCGRQAQVGMSQTLQTQWPNSITAGSWEPVRWLSSPQALSRAVISALLENIHTILKWDWFFGYSWLQNEREAGSFSRNCIW